MASRNKSSLDLSAALAHLRRDKALAPLLGSAGGLSLKPNPAPSPLYSLAQSITGQQLHGRAATAIFERFLLLCGEPLLPDSILGKTEEALRSAGLSRAKAIAVLDLAEKAKGGAVPGWQALRKMDDEAIIQRLTQVRGIGRWTVEMMLIFCLGRPDVWPVGDYAIKKAYSQLVGTNDPKPAEMTARAECWRPWRSVVARLLWKSLDETAEQPKPS